MMLKKKRLQWFVLFNRVYNFSNAKSSLSILCPLHSEHRLSLRHPSESGSRTWWDPNMKSSGRHVGSKISGKRSYTAENDRRHVSAVSSRNVGVKTARKWALMRQRGGATCIKLGGVCQPNSYIRHDQYLRNKRDAAGAWRCFVPGVFIVKQGPLAAFRSTILQRTVHLDAPQFSFVFFASYSLLWLQSLLVVGRFACYSDPGAVWKVRCR